MADSYTITDPAEVYGLGPCVGTVTNALTGVTEACFRGGQRVPLNVPLCTGCDEPLADGHCPDCDEPAVARQAA